FAVIELIRIASAYATLPAAVAFDVVWPAYHLETYAGWVTEDERWLNWGGWRLFFGQYLTPLVAGLLVVGGLAWAALAPRRPRGFDRSLQRDLRLLLPALFLLLGAIGYLQQGHLLRQFLW